ncbi:hypothetical protein DYB30_009566 [Aphanomyces astaci]|uniref:C2 domain-containing protein n=2 Tax=Aphanomyces astaci TaxID=112090 RepID=A0A397D124_APHAT|nr:hypothetical protein DYB30_009566 [Aphanomyces astaci]
MSDSEVPLRYINLYGPPLKHADAKAGDMMKLYPDHASTYRGRLLVSFAHVSQPNPDDSDRFVVKEVEDEDWEALKPPLTRYVLRLSLLAGQDLPTVRAKTGLPARLFVVVAIGPHELRFEANAAKNGSIVWGLTQEMKNIVLASDLTQVPDIIVTLCKETSDTDDPVGVSFARLRAGDVVARGMAPAVTWLHLRQEICRKGSIPVGQHPGSLLLRMAFAREEVRVHIFQCKGLVVDDLKSKGTLPDPLVQVHFNGVTRKTKPRSRTLDPLYYESLQFDTTIPAKAEYAGEVWIQVVNKIGFNTVKYMGEYRVPLAKCTKASTVPYPSWVPLTKSDLMDDAVAAGQLLVSVQIIEHPTAEDRTAALPSIVPECREAYVDIIALGVRNLKNNNLLHIQNPFVEFELTGLNSTSGENNIQRRTKASHEPTSKNANFLERLVIPTRLPIDILFAPQLVLKVYDSTLAGLHQPLIASCVIDLTLKLPWSPSYEPPQQQAFDYHIDAAKKRSKQRRVQPKAETPAIEVAPSNGDSKDEKHGITETHDDDGTGIGVLALPAVSFEATDESKQDPAVLHQVQQAHDRRLFASVQDAKKKGHVYFVSDPNAMVSSSFTSPDDEAHALDSPAYYAGRDWWLKVPKRRELVLLPSLEDVIRLKIDKAFTDAIELSKEIDTYHDVAAAAMKCIVLGIENILDDDWATMQRVNWGTVETVGDESAYVLAIADKLRPYVPTLRSMLSSLYFTNFCDKFAASVVPKVLQSIVKCKRVNHVGTQQLLLDVYALKTLFLNLPVMGKEGEVQIVGATTVPARYTKFVSNEMAHVEAVLKLIGTPNEMLVDSFKIMWPEGTAENFQSILNMKGLKRQEQLALLEALGLQQRKAPPAAAKQMIEGKMTDMTESLKSNMQKMAKASNPFNYINTTN